MSMILIHNPDSGRGVAYKIARVVYAESGANSLPIVEALTSMIENIHLHTGRDFEDIISDEKIFNVLDTENPNHEKLKVPATSRAFQMCVRVATRMIAGGLVDTTRGATMFHHDNEIPTWATSRGYIAEIGDMLFYR